nr:MAG TPA: hypothetical protein [Caudoviricetes sp.]
MAELFRTRQERDRMKQLQAISLISSQSSLVANVADEARKLEVHQQIRKSDRTGIDVLRSNAEAELRPFLQGQSAQFESLFGTQVNGIIANASTTYVLTQGAVKPSFNGTTPILAQGGEEAYRKLKPPDLDTTFKRGHSILKSNMPLYEFRPYGVKQGTKESFDALQQISQQGMAMLYDLESLGSEEGMRGQRLTEFSFSIVKGQFGSSAAPEIGKTYGSIIGISKKDADKYRHLLQRYKEGGATAISKGEFVTLQRFALAGSDKTKLGKMSKTGVQTFENFAEENDIAMSIAEMERGIKLYEDVYKEQDKRKLASGMFGWEEELLNAFSSIKKNNLVTVGHNIRVFDNTQLRIFAQSDITSAAFKKRAEALLGPSLALPKTFDTLPDLRRMSLNGESVTSKILNGNQENIRKQLDWRKEHDKTELTQEAILHAIELRDGGGRIQSGAHNAKEDAKGLAAVLFQSGLYGPDSVTPKIARPIMGDGTQLYYAINSTANATKTYGLQIYSMDPLTQEWRSSDAFSIGPLGVKKESFSQSGIKRRSLFTIEGMGLVDNHSPLYDAMATSHPDLRGAIHYMRVKTYTTAGDKVVPTTHVISGSAEDLTSWMNDNSILYGTRSKSLVDRDSIFDFNMDVLTEEEKAQFDRLEIRNGKATTLHAAKLRNETNLKYLLGDSTIAHANDAAARVMREKDSAKDLSVLNWIQAVDDAVQKRLSSSGITLASEDQIELMRKEFREQVYQKTQDIFFGKTTDIQGSFFQYFGFTYNGENRLYSNTVANLTGLETYYRANKDIYRAAHEYAAKHAGDVDTKNPLYRMHYKRALDMLEGKAYSKVLSGNIAPTANEINKAAQGPSAITRGRILGEVGGTFEVSLNGFKGIQDPDGAIYSFKTHGSGMGMADAILSRMGLKEKDIKTISETSKAMLLRDFQEHLISKKVINRSDNYNFDPINDPLDSIASKLLAQFREAQKLNPNHGLMRDSVQYFVGATNINNLGLSDEDITETLSKTGGNFQIIPNNLKRSNVQKKIRYEIDDKARQYLAGVAKDINHSIINFYGNGIPNVEDKEKFISWLTANGYSQNDARKVYEQQAVRAMDSFNTVNQIVQSVYSAGGQMAFDKDSGKVWVYENERAVAQNAGQEIYLPLQRWENGVFVTKVGKGRQRHVQPIGLFKYGRDNNKLQVSSITGQYLANRGSFLSTRLQNAAYEGGLTDELGIFISGLNQAIRGFSEASVGDSQDAKLANTVYTGDFVAALPQLAHTTPFRNLQPNGDPVTEMLISMRDKASEFEGKSFSDLTPGQQTAWLTSHELVSAGLKELDIKGAANAPHIFGPLGRLETSGRSPLMLALDDTENILEGYELGKNKIQSKVSRAEKQNVAYATNLVVGSRAGAAFRGEFELASATGLSKEIGYSVDTSFVVGRLSMTTDNLRRLGQLGLENKYLSQSDFLHKFLSSASTDEGSGFVTSQVADAMLSSRTYEQRINVDRVSENDTNMQRFLEGKGKFGDVTSTFGRVNGEMRYIAGSVAYVREGEHLFYKNSLTGDESVRAKTSGFLTMKFYKDRMEVKEEQINKILKQNEARIKGAGDSQSEIIRILAEHGITRSFAVEALTTSGQAKAADMYEKSMSRFLMVGMGEQNTRIQKVFETLGVSELAGTQVTADVIDQLKDGVQLDRTKFGAWINSMRTSKKMMALSGRQIHDAIIQHYNSVGSFGKAAFTERHSASQQFRHMLLQLGIIQKGESMGGVFNNLPGVKKHQNLTNLKTLVLSLQNPQAYSSSEGIKAIERDFGAQAAKKGLSQQQIVGVLNQILPGAKLVGKEIVYDADAGQIDYDIMQAFAEMYFPHQNNEYFLDKDGNKLGKKSSLSREIEGIAYEKAPTEIRKLTQYSEGSASNTGRRDLKLGVREIENLNFGRFGSRWLEGAQDTFSQATGNEALGKGIYDAYFSNAAANQRYQETLIQRAREGRWYTPGKDRIFDSFNTNFTSKEYERGIERLRKEGVSDKAIDAYTRQFIEEGAQTISADKIIEFHEATSAIAAKNFNVNDGTLSEQTMSSMGFHRIGIDDVITDKNITAIGELSSENSVMGQAALVDLHSEQASKLGAKQLYNSPVDKMFALPFASLGQQDDEGKYTFSPAQSKMIAAKKNYERYLENYGIDDKAADSYYERARAKLEEARSEVNIAATTKHSAIKKAATSHLTEGAIYSTAQGHTFTETDFNEAFKDFTFGEGDAKINIAKTNKRGAFEMSYAVIGRHHFDAMYSDEYMNTLTGGDKQLAQALKGQVEEQMRTGGSLANVVRHPSNQSRSIGAEGLYLSDSVKGDQILINEAGMAIRSGDFDADALVSAMHKSRASYEIGGKKVQTSLDYASYQALQQMGINVTLHDDVFEQAHREAYHAAVTYHTDAYVRVRSPETTVDSLSTVDRSQTYDGSRSVVMKRRYDYYQQQEQQAAYDRYLSQYRNATGMTEDEVAELSNERSESFMRDMKEKLYATAPEQKESIDQAMHFHAWRQLQDVQRKVDSSKASAGMLNDTVFKMGRVINASGAYNADELQLINAGLQGLMEGALSAKSETGEAALNKVEQLQSMHQQAWNLMQYGTDEQRAEHAKQMTAYYKSVFMSGGEPREEFELLAHRLGTNDISGLANRGAELLGNSVMRVDGKGMDMSFFRLGIGLTGFKDNQKIVGLDIADDPFAETVKSMNAAARKMGVEQNLIEIKAGPSSRATQSSTDELVSAAQSLNSQDILPEIMHASPASSIGSGVADVIKRMSKGHAIASIAGGLLLSGYVSGHAQPDPAQNQASDAASYNDAVGQKMSLSDTNLAVMNGGPKTGYMININATSPQGQAAAVSAISTAASSMSPQTGSINTTINTSYSNTLQQFQVNRMVAHALGVA